MTTCRMSISDGVALVVFMLISRLFLANTAEAVNQGAGLAWLHYAVAAVPALVAGLVLIFLQNRCGGDLLSTVEILLGKNSFYLVGIFYVAIFLFNSVFLTRQISENSLLIGLKDIDLALIAALYVAASGISVYFGLEALARTAYILLPVIVGWMFFIFAMLIPYYNIYNLAPWQGTGASTVIYHGLANAGANIGVLIIPILAPFFQNLRTKVESVFWGSAAAALLKILFVIVFLLTIGVETGREIINPFYEISSMAYFDKYFERLESFTVFLLVFLGITGIGVSMYIVLYLTARMFDLPTARPLIPLLSVIVYYLARLPDNAMSALEADLFTVKVYFGLGLYVVPGLLGAAFLFRNFRNKRG